MQREGVVNPGHRPVWCQLRQGLPDVHTRDPVAVFGENLPADFQNIRVGTESGRDVIELIIGRLSVAQLQPAFGGEQVHGVGGG